MPNSWTCVDASVVVRLFTEPGEEAIRDRWHRRRSDGVRLTAPTLLRYEVTNALYRAHRSGLMTAEALGRSLQAVLALPIRLRSDPDLHQTALDFAARFSLPAAYDAHYLALADRLGAEFWTADRRLANTVRPALPWVHVVGE